MSLAIGSKLYGYCNGFFGDNYNEKRVEVYGADWIVVRSDTDEPLFASFWGWEDRMSQLIAEWQEVS